MIGKINYFERKIIKITNIRDDCPMGEIEIGVIASIDCWEEYCD